MVIEIDQSHAKPNKYIAEINQKAIQLDEIRVKLVEVAEGLIGAKSIRYRSSFEGMSEEGGFDCSGLVCHAIKSVAILTGEVNLGDIPRHANEQWRNFGEPVHYGTHQAGDLVYFASRKIAGRYVVGHVGRVTGKGQYVHSPGRDGEVVEVQHLPKKQIALEDTRDDDIYTVDPVGIKRLSLPLGVGRWNIY